MFTLAGVNYPTKVSVQRAVQQELAGVPFRTEFSSPLLSDLVNHYHYRASVLHLHAIRFKKEHAFSGLSSTYTFYAFFEEIGWHDVSWHKCLTPPRYQDEVRAYLRWLTRDLTLPQRKTACESCGATSGLQVDHNSPTFNEMFREVFAVFSQDEVANWAYHDWLRYETFHLPPNHPAVRLFYVLHETATLRTLCQPCRAKVTVQREKESA